MIAVVVEDFPDELASPPGWNQFIRKLLNKMSSRGSKPTQKNKLSLYLEIQIHQGNHKKKENLSMERGK